MSNADKTSQKVAKKTAKVIQLTAPYTMMGDERKVLTQGVHVETIDPWSNELGVLVLDNCGDTHFFHWSRVAGVALGKV